MRMVYSFAMPRFPGFAERSQRITGSVYEKYRARMAAAGEQLVGLHIGDAHANPPYHLPLDASFARAHAGFHRYCDTFGVMTLRDELVAKVRDDNALPASRENVLVTAGATNALSATVQALVDPGDDVMVLSPYWPFFRGMVRAAGGNVVEVPLYTTLYQQPDAEVAALLESSLTPKTVVLYLNSPNNPSGKVLSRTQLEAVASFAQRHDLWLVSDEAYDGMTFDGRTHVSPGSFDGMLERTVSVFTFSKVFMFAGLRLGYAVAGETVIRAINKAMVHQLYSPSTVAQQMMVEPVRTRAAWSGRFVAECAAIRDRVASELRVDAPLPEGAYYFFFPIDAYLRGRAFPGVIDALLDAGVSVAPGEDFGADFASWIRICFAGEATPRVLSGVERLNRVLAG
jgi:aspartate/methionine/tyrosine aminotransferase